MGCPNCGYDACYSLHDCPRCGRGAHGGMTPQEAQNLQNAGEQLGYRIGYFFVTAAKFAFSRPMSYVWFCIFGVGITVVIFHVTGIANLDDPEVPEWMFALPMVLGLAWSIPLARYWREYIPRIIPWVLGAMVVMAIVDMCWPAR